MKETNWFKTWFDSKYYHLLYKNRSQKEADDFIDKLVLDLCLNKDKKVLDLGCGKGRHSIKLGQYFKEVIGIDLSPNSINSALKTEEKNIQFQIGDMRNFNTTKGLGYIFNLFTSFGYFDNINDNLKVLKRCHLHLEQDGQLIIDYLNPSNIIKKTFINEHKQINRVDFNITKKIDNNKVIKNISINDSGNIYHFQERVQLFNLNDFKTMLNKTGFQIQSIFGNYQLNKFVSSSDRLIILAKKIN